MKIFIPELSVVNRKEKEAFGKIIFDLLFMLLFSYLGLIIFLYTGIIDNRFDLFVLCSILLIIIMSYMIIKQLSVLKFLQEISNVYIIYNGSIYVYNQLVFLQYSSKILQNLQYSENKSLYYPVYVVSNSGQYLKRSYSSELFESYIVSEKNIDGIYRLENINIIKKDTESFLIQASLVNNHSNINCILQIYDVYSEYEKLFNFLMNR